MSTATLPRVWRMRTHLSALLVVTMLLTVGVVGSAILVARLPVIERESQADLQAEVEQLAGRLELLLGTAQNRLELLDSLVDGVEAGAANALLDEGLRTGLRFDAAYRLSPRGVVQAAGVLDAWKSHRDDLIGSDLSSNSLFQEVSQRSGAVWSGRYRSVLTGLRAVGLAVRDDEGQVLVAEVSSEALLRAVQVAAGRRASSVWIVDRHGDVLVDTDGGREQGRLNIRDWPLMQAQSQGGTAVVAFEHRGQKRHAAIAHSSALDWTFVGHAPQGLANPRVQRLVSYLGASFAGCLVVGLLVAPFWAQRLTRPLQRILERAAQTTRGEGGDQAWPRGAVAEFNQLSGDLETIANALMEREQKFLAIFNAAPVPMSVTDARRGYILLDVNAAWCREFGYTREAVVGRSGVDIGMVSSAQNQDLAERLQEPRLQNETMLRRGDGTLVQVQVFAQRVVLATQELMLWAVVDIGPLRRVEQQLRELNQQLGARVAQRTEALAASNTELATTVEQLRAAQEELVRTEKMAALGGLVAGVAHELNTPLGNGVMAVSSMADAVRRFKAGMASGIRRNDLQQVLDGVEQGTDIAGRNLHRAADLVHSFKQVAVDRTSAQRRSFELGEVVHEMVVSLKPSFARKPWRIEVDVPEQGLRLDSYPGALGQVLGNLIQNAVVHGFDGRAHGTVRITAGRGEGRTVWLRVADDGHGIAPEHIARVFDPFMTTRMGRGGTGLGLHISHNAVTTLLGGTLGVQSTPGQGACFELCLPEQAPRAQTEALPAGVA
ncbi:ATP-binding protein [Pseudorhodoferax sp.]|uniref:ATP-binding protein n=1 Tax=Pseudorhodoferax sp. TaxID=1993553 RepID=UPI002DD61E9C|nr:ATP-binding protein [Pseudorhodoferax sp.]